MRIHLSGFIAITVAVNVFTFSASAQTPARSAQTPARPKTAGVKPGPAPRTSAGKPDLTGVWGVVDRASTDVDRLARQESLPIEERYGRLESEKPSLTPWAQERFDYNADPRKGFGGA